jgi:hypothetical protein
MDFFEKKKTPFVECFNFFGFEFTASDTAITFLARACEGHARRGLGASLFSNSATPTLLGNARRAEQRDQRSVWLVGWGRLCGDCCLESSPALCTGALAPHLPHRHPLGRLSL